MERKSTPRTNNLGERKLAPGMLGVEGLNQEARPEDIAEGNSTQITKLEFDEYDESQP